MKDIDQIIKEVNETMTMEGMPLNKEDRERLKLCLSGKVSFEEMKKRIVKKHTTKI